MFVATATRTMAHAKFKPREDDGTVVVSLIEKRRTLALEAIKRGEEEKARKRAMLELERKAANDAILAARIAALRFQENQFLKEFVGFEQRPIVIVKRICRAFGVTPADILSPCRERQISFARQACCYWLCRRTCKSQADIGRLLGIDHTTVMHSRRVYPEKRREMGRKLRRVR